MENTLAQQLSQTIAAAHLLQEFLEAHPISLPGHSFAYISTYGPQITIEVETCSEASRDRILAAVGDAWGREGWRRKQGQSRATLFDFHRAFDGVTLVIRGAQALSPSEDTPVPASAFPLMLEDGRQSS